MASSRGHPPRGGGSPAFQDITGRAFGRWTVLERAANNGRGGARWRCRCSCGTEGIVGTGALNSGASRSCGCLKRELSSSRRGAKNPGWKGDAIRVGSGRCRAQRLYPLGPCERCGEPGTDRHHKDGDTRNNVPSNIAILCQSCHMAADGRAKALADIVRARPPVPPKPCRICGKPWKGMRHGRCASCADYYRRHKTDRFI